MEVHFRPDTEKKLNDIALQSGGSVYKIVENAWFRNKSAARRLQSGS